MRLSQIIGSDFIFPKYPRGSAVRRGGRQPLEEFWSSREKTYAESRPEQFLFQ